MTTEQYIKLGRQVALISFLLGTVIFGLYFMTSSFELLFVGYGFIVLTGLINIVILILILFKANKGVFLKSPFYVGQFIWAQRDTNVGGTTFCIYKTMYR